MDLSALFLQFFIIHFYSINAYLFCLTEFCKEIECTQRERQKIFWPIEVEQLIYGIIKHFCIFNYYLCLYFARIESSDEYEGLLLSTSCFSKMSLKDHVLVLYNYNSKFLLRLIIFPLRKFSSNYCEFISKQLSLLLTW